MANWFTINDESFIQQAIIADDLATAQSFLGEGAISSEQAVVPGWIWNAETQTAKAPRPEKPYESWVWDEEVEIWRAPIGKRKPQDDKNYEWQEDTQTWLEV
jgi:hypothetical protein